MRRAVVVLAFLLLASMGRNDLSHADHVTIDGSGFVDYTRKPNFKVGSWVRYHMLGSSLQGFRDDYTVTMLIAGEEMWWGEPCFWIETWTNYPGDSPRLSATLVSYAAFEDSIVPRNLRWFLRKNLEGVDEKGNLYQSLIQRGRGEFLQRGEAKNGAPDNTQVDSLGVDTVSVPKGHFTALKIRRVKKVGETTESGDSTVLYRHREERIEFYSDEVPITHLVRSDIDDVQEGKTWLSGKSNNDPLNVLERARGSNMLVDYGDRGLEPLLVPPKLRKTLAQQEASEAKSGPARAPRPPTRRSTRRGS